MIMTTAEEFQLEEYRRLSQLYETLLGRNETLFRYCVIGAAVVYSWLVVEGFGHTAASACLKLPADPLKLAWFIPVILSALTLCLAATQTYRARQITVYLETVEQLLGHRGFGWEKWIRPKPSVLTVGIGSLWMVFLAVTVAVASLASVYIDGIIDPAGVGFCPSADEQSPWRYAMSTSPPALIIIDMQKGMASPAAGPRNNPDAEHNIATLLAAWRKAGAAVVHVRHVSRTVGSPFWPGQPGAEFQEALAPLPGEHVVEKNVPDALVNSGLERWLRVRGIARLAIVGVSTNNSVEATTRTAGNLGFDTQVVADACFTFDKADYAGTRRTAAEVHAMSLANLDGEYATVTTTRRLLDALIGQAR